MRGAIAAIVATSILASCSATEGPLLRAVGSDSGAPEDPGNPASAGEPRILPGMSFQYQLVGDIDVDLDAQLFVIDLFNAGDGTIDALHADGKVVAAYLSAGTLEDFRDDAEQFPASAVGEPLAAYPDESWLDVRDPTVRELMAARLDVAREQGFDAVLPTNLQGYAQNNGLALTAADLLDYALWLAAQIHARGLAPGLGGDFEQVDALVDHFDWAVHFGCLSRGDCEVLAPFVAQGKPVFDLEYEGDIDALCAQAASYDLSVIRKNLRLDAYREACP
jgi:hypothetical protein